MFAMKVGVAGFFSPAINATVFKGQEFSEAIFLALILPKRISVLAFFSNVGKNQEKIVGILEEMRTS